MKSIARILFVVLLGILMIGCSAERQLANLLRRHPELHTMDTLKVYQVEFRTEYEKNDTVLPSLTDGPCDCDSLIRAKFKNGVSTTAGNARASVFLNEDGRPTLRAEQLPDTVILRDTVEVPVYVFQPADPEPEPEKPIQSFFRISGIVVWLLILIAFVVRIVKLFI